jgi:hypothetical protein
MDAIDRKSATATKEGYAGQHSYIVALDKVTESYFDFI